MKATTVRFSEALWDAIEAEAERQGISAAQLIREATILRVGALGGLGERAASEVSLEEIERRGDLGGPGTGSGRDREPILADQRLLADPERIAALDASGLLDSGADPSFDRITRIASRLLDAPVALVSLVTDDRQYFKSCLGLPEEWEDRRETPLTHSFCQHVVEQRTPFLVSDAREHPLVRDNLAIRDLGVIAYAGIPLVTEQGQALGSLCVIDDQPRDWTDEHVSVLEDLAGTVVELISAADAERRTAGREA